MVAPALPGRIAFCNENNRLVAHDLRAGSPRSGPPIHIAQKRQKNRHSRERFSLQPPIYGDRCATTGAHANPWYTPQDGVFRPD